MKGGLTSDLIDCIEPYTAIHGHRPDQGAEQGICICIRRAGAHHRDQAEGVSVNNPHLV